jgi:hypothetical protein
MFVFGAALIALAGCSNPAEKGPHARKSGVQADTDAPRTCRDWTIRTATLQCSSAVMQITGGAANGAKVQRADEKLSRYGPLGPHLCKDTGAAVSERDSTAAVALSDAVKRAQTDKTSDSAVIVSLCHDAVIKMVARAEEHAEGRNATADLHPNVDDTPKTANGGD